MICPNCGHYCTDPPKFRLSDERIAELWFQAGHHLHKFAKLLVEEIEKHG